MWFLSGLCDPEQPCIYYCVSGPGAYMQVLWWLGYHDNGVLLLQRSLNVQQTAASAYRLLFNWDAVCRASGESTGGSYGCNLYTSAAIGIQSEPWFIPLGLHEEYDVEGGDLQIQMPGVGVDSADAGAGRPLLPTDPCSAA